MNKEIKREITFLTTACATHEHVTQDTWRACGTMIMTCDDHVTCTCDTSSRLRPPGHASSGSRKRMEAMQAVRQHARKPQPRVEAAMRVRRSLRDGARTLSVASWIPTEPRLLVVREHILW